MTRLLRITGFLLIAAGAIIVLTWFIKPLRALWPYKDNYMAKAGPMLNEGIGDQLGYVILAAIAGGATVSLLALLERRILAVDARDGA